MYSPQTSDYTQKSDLEETFRETLDNIRTSYRAITNQAFKIRVEKWCSKLVATGSSSGNRVFAKHRNDYARLLLYMVQKRKFEEPFHVLPPDGPLPSFPNHQRIHISDSSDRETTFWSDLREDLDRNQGTSSSSSSSSSSLFSSSVAGANLISSSSSSSSSSSALNALAARGAKGGTRLSPNSLKSSGKGDMGRLSCNFYNKEASTVGVGDDARQVEAQIELIGNQGKEIDRLVVQAKEYEKRIEQLEQSLREERIKHDLAVQRLRHDHRLELAKLEAGANRSSPTSAAYEYEKRYHKIHSTSAVRSNGSAYNYDSDDERGDEGTGTNKKQSKIAFSARANDSLIAGADSDFSRKYDNKLIPGSVSSAAADKSNTKSNNNDNGGNARKPILGKSQDDEFLDYIEKFQDEIRKSVNMDDDE